MADDVKRLTGWEPGHAEDDAFEFTLQFNGNTSSVNIVIPCAKVDDLVGALNTMKRHAERLNPDT